MSLENNNNHTPTNNNMSTNNNNTNNNSKNPTPTTGTGLHTLLRLQISELDHIQKCTSQIVSDLSTLLQSWFVGVWKKHLQQTPDKKADPANPPRSSSPRLVLFGSSRIFDSFKSNPLLSSFCGEPVSRKSIDLDMVCLVPSLVTLEDWSSGFGATLENNSRASEVRIIRTARVPLISFLWDSDTSVDILFARLPSQVAVPESVSDLNDKIFRQMDSKSIQSLNGVCDTESLVNTVPDLYQFQYLLSVVKLWAKQRGIYGNKFGFLGGYSWGVCCAYVCKKNPSLKKLDLIKKFFETFKSWDYSTPITTASSCNYKPDKKKDLLMIMTNSDPIKNSTQNISRSTLQLIKEEFVRAEKITLTDSENDWPELCLLHSFFADYTNFVVVTCSGLTRRDFLDLKSWFESVSIGLVYKLEKLENFFVRPLPLSFSNSQSNFPFSVFYLFGIKFVGVKDPAKAKGMQSNFLIQLNEYESTYERNPIKNQNMDFSVKQKNIKQLPSEILSHK